MPTKMSDFERLAALDTSGNGRVDAALRALGRSSLGVTVLERLLAAEVETPPMPAEKDASVEPRKGRPYPTNVPVPSLSSSRRADEIPTNGLMRQGSATNIELHRPRPSLLGRLSFVTLKALPTLAALGVHTFVVVILGGSVEKLEPMGVPATVTLAAAAVLLIRGLIVKAVELAGALISKQEGAGEPLSTRSQLEREIMLLRFRAEQLEREAHLVHNAEEQLVSKLKAEGEGISTMADFGAPSRPGY
ncbi:hypothetical protein HPC49_42490 [Pyxidicoccus fallax]|uniref:Uncharacterized protein n=1 Tax=Pyxidicoccus fallax TaxID=394095 RepID=A0A848LP82_9BACT|nr:hypothetical protein [Pyxidicoccus fallax]NMO19470.1 hypothetical protein [Pyxidicoccus fallax]NPC84875.1 hypothetical protein [Pyxidicoccus fallax]